MKKIVFVLLGIALLAVACEDDDKEIIITQPQELCDSLDVLYTQDIAPLLDEVGCSGVYCHGGGAGGVSLNNWVNTKAATEDPKFLKAIRHELGASPMPKGRDKMTDQQIELIECWIKSGSRE